MWPMISQRDYSELLLLPLLQLLFTMQLSHVKRSISFIYSIVIEHHQFKSMTREKMCGQGE